MTLTEATTYRDACQDALTAALSNASHSIGNRSKTNQSITELRTELDRAQMNVDSLQRRANGKSSFATASFS